MHTITVRFSPELKFFLTMEQRDCALIFPCVDAAAVKHPIESLGVPHTEVGSVLVNGRAVTFGEQVIAGDSVSVYGHHDAPLSPRPALLRCRLARPPRFVLDTHLGRLARYLRLLGFDALYRNDYPDEELAAISAGQRRVLLTRDRGLLKRKIVEHGHCPRATDPRQQVVDIARRFDLAAQLTPYTRCMACNGELEAISKHTILHLLKPKTRLHYELFKRCSTCGRLFWRGSHSGQLDSLVELVQTEL